MLGRLRNQGGEQFFLVTPKRVILDPGFSAFLFHSLYWPKLGCGLSPLLMVFIGYIPCNSSWGTVGIIVRRLWAG